MIGGRRDGFFIIGGHKEGLLSMVTRILYYRWSQNTEYLLAVVPRKQCL